jgi:outer membrane protein assembly factor BamB
MTGAPSWTFTPNLPYQMVVLDPVYVYVSSSLSVIVTSDDLGVVYGLNPDTGIPYWTFMEPNYKYSLSGTGGVDIARYVINNRTLWDSPSVVLLSMYATTAYDVSSGISLWTFPFPAPPSGPMYPFSPNLNAVIDQELNTVYYTLRPGNLNSNSFLIALDLQTGAQKWRQNLIGGGGYTLLLARTYSTFDNYSPILVATGANSTGLSSWWYAVDSYTGNVLSTDGLVISTHASAAPLGVRYQIPNLYAITPVDRTISHLYSVQM